MTDFEQAVVNMFRDWDRQTDEPCYPVESPLALYRNGVLVGQMMLFNELEALLFQFNLLGKGE